MCTHKPAHTRKNIPIHVKLIVKRGVAVGGDKRRREGDRDREEGSFRERD